MAERLFSTSRERFTVTFCPVRGNQQTLGRRAHPSCQQVPACVPGSNNPPYLASCCGLCSGGSIAAALIAWRSGEASAEITSTAILTSPAALHGPLRLAGGLAVATSADGASICSAAVTGAAAMTCAPISALLGGDAVAAAMLGNARGSVAIGSHGAAVFSAVGNALREVAVFSSVGLCPTDVLSSAWFPDSPQ